LDQNVFLTKLISANLHHFNHNPPEMLLDLCLKRTSFQWVNKSN